jgi:hypothetical protein
MLDLCTNSHDQGCGTCTICNVKLMQSGSGTEVIPSVPDPEPQSQLSCASANIKKLVKRYIFFYDLGKR